MMDENDLVLPIHVSTQAKADVGLCGESVLEHVWPPEVVELGRRRRDGSVIALEDVELEAGWIAIASRHVNAAKVDGLCQACLVKVGKLREGTPAQQAIRKTTAKIASVAQRKRCKDAAWEARILDGIDE